MTLPAGWTDDMNIAIPDHRTLEDVVSLVISMALQGGAHELVQGSLVEDLGLSPDDAALAWDRVHGGIVRAATRNPANCPDRAKDPLAWLSFQQGMQDRSIVAALYPQYATLASTRPWWKFW